MSVVEDIVRLLAETPKYLSHITVSKILLEKLLEELKELKSKLEEKK